MELALLFLVLLMSIAVNQPDGVIARFGLDPGYLLAALLAIVIAGLLVHRQLLLIVTVLALSIGANTPEAYLLSLGVDRDYLFATLIGLVLIPLFFDAPRQCSAAGKIRPGHPIRLRHRGSLRTCILDPAETNQAGIDCGDQVITASPARSPCTDHPFGG